MFKSFLEQRLNFIFTHLEEYQTSLRPFQQEAASECKISDNLTIERRGKITGLCRICSLHCLVPLTQVFWNNVSISFLRIRKNTKCLYDLSCKKQPVQKNGSITIERMEEYWICTVKFGSSDSLGGLLYYFNGNLERHKSSVYRNFMLSFPISKWIVHCKQIAMILAFEWTASIYRFL